MKATLKKRVIAGLGILLIGFFVFYFGKSFLLEEESCLKDRVIVAAYREDLSLLVYLAQHKGLFQKYGIEVQIKELENKEQVINILGSEKADLFSASEEVLVERSFKQPDLKVLSVLAETRFDKLTPRRSSFSLLFTRDLWVNQNPKLAQRLIKALIEAERILIENKDRVFVFFKKAGFRRQHLKQALANNHYYVYLPQTLLLELEEQAIWRIEEGLVDQDRIPNYLNFIYPYALEAVNPSRVTMIR